ncbi:putative F-box protein At3g10430 [Papaver somniferum]|uniref:putative F-box protein At3g10430 n=1 Tax=Papaver somniferum TaxID=3469 RepID=UPI000E6F85BB|nr:putative F-box protein At3g10430 [Papaver somniferum]XP_026400310.1 putative F-box protein At3g10430 [Papaver somniferum]
MRNFNFNHLPTEIILDMITRLPADSILNCKLVCRPWRDLVSHHPSFYQMYLSHLNRSTDSGKLSFIDRADKKFHYFEYDENNKETPINCIRRININPQFENYHYYVLGSVNGLIYLYEWRVHTYYICNPVTREYVMLPKTSDDQYGNLCYGCFCVNQYIHFGSGFGYDSLADEYKVVELYKLRRNTSFIKVGVYTLGSGKGWRIVGRLDYKICKFGAHGGVFGNGALHWVDKEGGRVLTFDLTEEKFHQPLSPPPSPCLGVMPFGTVGLLDGVLYYVTTHDYKIIEDRCLDIWLLRKKNDIPDMKEQVENESLGWSKEFGFIKREPLAFTKRGSVLFTIITPSIFMTPYLQPRKSL